MFYLDLAMRLKRTLILPRSRLLRRIGRGSQFSPDADYLAWGELFNMSVLSRVHPVMELEQYLKLQGGHVDLHVRISHAGCEPIDGPISIAFNGLAAGGGGDTASVRAARSICANGLQYNQRALTGSDYASLNAVAFSDSVDQLGPAQALPLRAYVRFEQRIYNAAANFVAEAFGGEPFIAFHWRRTDFLYVRAARPGVLQSADELVRHAHALMQRHHIKHVYLSTDSTDSAELAHVQKALPSVARYQPMASKSAAPGGSLRERAEVANIEIAICAMAAHFRGTQTSSFSLAISEERVAVFGHAQESGGEMAHAPPGGDKDEL